MNIGSLFVSLQADAKPLKKGVQEASTALDGIGAAAKRVGGALAGMFAAQQVVSFGADSIRTFAEAEAIWSRLGSAVNATGTSFESVQGEIQGAAAAMQAATTVGDEDFAQALQRLTIHTGDVQRGLGAMGLVADLAAAKQIGVADAADLVGRAMAGNTTALTRMFPALKGSTDLFGDLQRLMGDAAENQAKTFSGRMEQISNNFGDLKEALGGALVGMGGFDNVMVRVRDGLKAMEFWVVSNADAFQTLGSAIVDFGGWVVRDIGATIKQLRALLAVVDDIKAAMPKNIGRMGYEIGRTPAAAAVAPMVRLDDSIAAAAGNIGALASVVGRTTGTITTSTGRITKGIKDSTAAVKTWFDEMRGALARPITPQDRLDQAGMAGKVPALPALSLRPVTAFGAALGVLSPATVQASYAMNMAGQSVREAAGYMIGGLNQFTSNAVNAGKKMMDAGVGFAAAGPAALVFAGIMEVLGGVFDVLGPLLNGILSPLKALGNLIGAFLAPAFTVLALAASYLSEGIYRVASFIMSAMGKFLEAVGGLLNKLPGSIGNPLIALGTSMRTQAASLEASAKAQQDYRKELIHGAEAVRKLTQSLSNVPPVFDYLTRRRQAAGAGAMPTAPAWPTAPSAPAGRPPITIEKVELHAAPGEDVGLLWDRLEREIERRARMGGTTGLQVALGIA